MTGRRLVVDANGVVAGARQVDSPNQNARPPGTAISLAVIHGISLPPGEFGGDGVERLFTNTLDAAADPYYASIADAAGVGPLLPPPRRRTRAVRAVRPARLARRRLGVARP